MDEFEERARRIVAHYLQSNLNEVVRDRVIASIAENLRQVEAETIEKCAGVAAARAASFRPETTRGAEAATIAQSIRSLRIGP